MGQPKTISYNHRLLKVVIASLFKTYLSFGCHLILLRIVFHLFQFFSSKDLSKTGRTLYIYMRSFFFFFYVGKPCNESCTYSPPCYPVQVSQDDPTRNVVNLFIIVLVRVYKKSRWNH